MSFVNIASYKFIDLENLPALRAELLQMGVDYNVKGTILISAEGINICAAGSRAGIDQFVARLHQDARFSDMVFKESIASVRSFRKMQVKIKDEIIKMSMPEIKPGQYTSQHLSPQLLQQWLDEGRDITLLDTRNDYEVKVGTFENAIDLNIETFTQFPHAAKDKLSEELRNKPLVMFCTGGVRCEKAGPALEAQGFTNVYQLDGGILKYFEECQGKHWQGECFVFDDRVALDTQLKASEKGLCPNCVIPLPEAYRHEPPYLRLKHCPACLEKKQAKKLQDKAA